ncbi:MAG TPA: RsmE family RNA methyltransferase [Acidimicrobiales bacterium]
MPEPVTPPSARAHVFVDDLDAPRLTDEDDRHLHRSLRLPAGSPVTVGDGAGRWRPCRLTDGSELVDVGDVVVDPAPEPRLTVAFALVKGERPELVVQKLTELGVDRIVPFHAERSVVRWEPAKADRQVERLQTIARLASMQCRRTHVPTVERVTDFAAVAALPGATMADGTGEPPSLSVRTVLVGPEGGWSPAERGFGLPLVRLGAHTLRSETAAITAGALLVAIRSRIVEPAVPAQVNGPHGT